MTPVALIVAVSAFSPRPTSRAGHLVGEGVDRARLVAGH